MSGRGGPRDQAHAIDMAVARRVRERRKQAGIAQARLAGMLGISYQQMAKHESATNRISAGRLAQIAAALGVPVSFFFEERAA